MPFLPASSENCAFNFWWSPTIICANDFTSSLEACESASCESATSLVLPSASLAAKLRSEWATRSRLVSVDADGAMASELEAAGVAELEGAGVSLPMLGEGRDREGQGSKAEAGFEQMGFHANPQYAPKPGRFLGVNDRKL